MIETSQLYNINFYKKEIFYGSDHGMRFKIERAETTPDTGKDPVPVFRVTIWPGPYCFDATPDEEKVVQEFPFSNEALANIADWLNREHDTHCQKK